MFGTVRSRCHARRQRLAAAEVSAEAQTHAMVCYSVGVCYDVGRMQCRQSGQATEGIRRRFRAAHLPGVDIVAVRSNARLQRLDLRAFANGKTCYTALERMLLATAIWRPALQEGKRVAAGSIV